MRPLRANIRLHHLRHNYSYLQQQSGGKLLAVLKANAYGHGAIRCAKALVDLADGFAVAAIEEALELRDSGISTTPILLLEGVFEPQEYALIEAAKLWFVIQNQTQLTAFLAHPWQSAQMVWLKMDTGMHRAGFSPIEYAAAYAQLKASRHVQHLVHATHFARADEWQRQETRAQAALFGDTLKGLDGDISMNNSAAILYHPKLQTHVQTNFQTAPRNTYSRAGLALYGVPSAADQLDVNSHLKPVMQLVTRVFAERELPPGEAVGYGGIFVTSNTCRIGLAAAGYADGYPRSAAMTSPVAIDGTLSTLAGRVSMDMMTLLLPSRAGIGSTVELWGDTVSVNAVASAAGTIAYELLCNVKRAKFVESWSP